MTSPGAPTLQQYINVGRAIRGAGRQMTKLQRRLDTAINGLLTLDANLRGDRYWKDVDYKIHRTPGKKPLLHNGGKPQ